MNNPGSVECGDFSAARLRWDDFDSYVDLADAFDFLICADCLFFVESHQQLLQTILHVLKPGGKAILFSPRRGTTLSRFKQLCKRSEMAVEVIEHERYCAKVTTIHEERLADNSLYNADLHYPILLELQKHS